MPRPPEPLMKGTMSSVPVRVHTYPGLRYLIMDATGTGCWTDPAHRVFLHKIEHVERVLKAHGYRLDAEDMTVHSIEEGATDADSETDLNPSEAGEEEASAPNAPQGGVDEAASGAPECDPAQVVQAGATEAPAGASEGPTADGLQGSAAPAPVKTQGKKRR